MVNILNESVVVSAARIMDPLRAPPTEADLRSLFLCAVMCRASRDGDIDQMRALLAMGAQVNLAGAGLPLTEAVLGRHLAAVQWLLQSGADVNASRTMSREVLALHAAVRGGDPEIMGLLLAAGADVHAKWNGTTALHHVAHSRTSPARCAELLLSYGARPDDSGDPQMTPLWFAMWNSRRDLVKILLRGGARMIAVADLPTRIHRSAGRRAAIEVLDAVRAAGGWTEYVVAHRRVLAGLVSKLSARRPLRLDAASRVVAFLCPDGGS